MDVPNAPNPANPNVQDQNVDVIQGPANQAEQNQVPGPTVQNPVQGPMNQNQAQVPAGPNSSPRSHSG